jgi:MFS family permease
MAAGLAVSLASATAPSAAVLVASRTIGGATGALVGASSMALVMHEHEGAERVRALGWWSLVGAGGPVLGVAIGGPLVQALGWRALFVVQLPLAATATLLAARLLPARAASVGAAARGPARRGSARHAAPGIEAARARPSELDWLGMGLVTVAAAALLIGLNRGPEWGWSSPAVVGSLCMALVAAVGFVAAEGRAANPVLPRSKLVDRAFVAPLGAQLFTNFAYMGGFFLAPLLLEQVYGASESAAGLLSIPRPLVYALIAPFAGRVAARVGERRAAVAGTAVVAVSMVVFVLAGRRALGVAELGLVLAGAGMGIATPPLGAAVANAVDREELGVAAAAQQLTSQVGTVAGIQVMQTAQASASRAFGAGGAGLLGAFHAAFGVGALAAAAGVAFAAALPLVRRATQPLAT